MKKYISVENKIYEAFPVIELSKINDEILATNRKSKNGNDKNQLFIQKHLFDNLNKFFPEVLKDREDGETGRNKPTIKNYFDLPSLLNDLGKINEEIETKFPNEENINIEEFYNLVTKLSNSQNLNTSFFIESEIANAQNGIAFKNWDKNFKPIIKELLLPTTQIKVFLFKKEDEVCALWQFNQDYIEHQNIIEKRIKSSLILEEKILRNIIFQTFKYLIQNYGEEKCLNGYGLKESEIEEREYEGLTINKYFGFEIFIGNFNTRQNNEQLKSSGTLRFINEKINILNNPNSYFTTQWNESNRRGLSLTNFNRFIADISNNTLEIIKDDDVYKLLLKKNVSFKPQNKIFFGAPGTGKSHKVKEITKIPEKQGRVERVTFHPEYDYTSFVGGYKPTMDGDNIRYEFIPQAFTNIYTKAWNDDNNDYFLVIEEINRGNCAEIFGDIFQLLDRTNDYKITPSKELKEHLKIELKDNSSIDSGKLLLPPNLTIFATMNTSDQSLFPMDSAFKRRWDWEYIPINYSRKVDENVSAKFLVIISDAESFKWLDFIEKINEKISQNDNLGMDKCLGNYFIKPENDEIEIETFINKVIFYLWSDVFKDEVEEDSIFKNKTTYENFFPIDDKNGKQKVRDILEDLKIDYKASI